MLSLRGFQRGWSSPEGGRQVWKRLGFGPLRPGTSYVRVAGSESVGNSRSSAGVFPAGCLPSLHVHTPASNTFVCDFLQGDVLGLLPHC